MDAEWAHSNWGLDHDIILDYINKRYGMVLHWSRQYEYPWVILNGDFHPGLKVLDAGGGESPLQYILAGNGCDVTNVDSQPIPNNRKDFRVNNVVGDIGKLKFPDDHFDRVLCVSVLEHCRGPLEICEELRRVLKPDGKLLLTFDVADNKRWNHTIDKSLGRGIVNSFKLQPTGELPNVPENILTQSFPEINPKLHELVTVNLNVLCLLYNKC